MVGEDVGGPERRSAAGRVLLCDDAVAFSMLFRQWMGDCDVELVGHADSADDAVAMADRLQPDVVVVDHLLGEITSEGLSPRLRAVAPAAKLLLISGMHDEQLAEAAEAAGADAHLSKAASARAMCAAVRSLLP
jgi:DNA-binding NarL/FixJ family response regulator